MPLRDHFHSPLDDVTSWDGLHGQWPAMIVLALSRELPPRYVAAPRIHTGSIAEIDVATFDTEEESAADLQETSGTSNGGVAVWAPSRPTLTVATDLPEADEYEVLVHDLKRGRRLVAAIELVSPANKDRPEHRRAFVAKSAGLLQKRVSVTIVDLVTTRKFNLYRELLELIGQADATKASPASPLYAVACRATRRDDSWQLETWDEPLIVGQQLPTLPLWLTTTLAVPLNLEETYEMTCKVLRIP
jgi:hypothetical protein